MKDETIRTGDLVMVIKGLPCGCSSPLPGLIFTALGFADSSRCSKCSELFIETSVYIGGKIKGRKRGIALSRLKKINPPAVDETVETIDKVTV